MQAWSALEPILCLLVKSIEVAVLLRYISDISCQIENANFQYRLVLVLVMSPRMR